MWNSPRTVIHNDKHIGKPTNGNKYIHYTGLVQLHVQLLV